MRGLFFCLVWLGVNSANAQVLPYLFQVDEQPYMPLDNAFSLTGNDNWEDPDYLFDIGFDFYGFGQWNNQMTFGGVFGYGGELFFGAFDGTLLYNHVCPYGLDIHDPNVNTDLPPIGHIVKRVDGTEPNRICKIEWQNVGFYLDQTGNMRTNFQLWLYESSNNIEYHYGPSENFSLEPLLELNGILVGLSSGFDFNQFTFNYLWTLNGGPDNPTLMSSDDFSIDLQVADQVSQQPESGTVYRFVNLEVNVDELKNKNWTAFPCPASDQLNISFTKDLFPKKYRIFDSTGKLVMNGAMNGPNLQINVLDLNNGLYHLVVNSNQNEYAKTISIIH
jgi:Secretion system C-terminal sorting domain